MEDLDSLIEEIVSCEECRVEPAIERIKAYGQAAVEPLSKLLTHEEADVRWWAAWGLGEIGGPGVSPLLTAALKDPAPQVRQAAALALRQQPDTAAIPALIDCLASSDAVLVRLASAALIALGGEAVPSLLEALKGPSQAARLEALRTLANIGDPRCVPALFEALDKDSALMEYWAAEGLERIGIGMRFFQP